MVETDKILFGEILAPDVAPSEQEKRAKNVRTKFWATLKRAIRYIPFSDELVAAYYCALDPATPHRVRAILIGALAYFVLPLDVVPDIFAGFGFTDDVTVLVAAIAMVRGHITESHRERARKALADEGF